ncbi:MAG: hypothetical protein ACLPN6_15160 [Streptosporangiaceae bacterium]|jgi:predicted anti-sigma-YlaC factor YlaD|nr:hypothetical protein [Actinomycetota bacterium]
MFLGLEAAVLPTRLPLHHFYEALVNNADRQYSDHLRETEYQLPPPAEHAQSVPDRKELCIHAPARRRA